jgi:hypothetical protein
MSFLEETNINIIIILGREGSGRDTFAQRLNALYDYIIINHEDDIRSFIGKNFAINNDFFLSSEGEYLPIVNYPYEIKDDWCKSSIPVITKYLRKSDRNQATNLHTKVKDNKLVCCETNMLLYWTTRAFIYAYTNLNRIMDPGFWGKSCCSRISKLVSDLQENFIGNGKFLHNLNFVIPKFERIEEIEELVIYMKSKTFIMPVKVNVSIFRLERKKPNEHILKSISDKELEKQPATIIYNNGSLLDFNLEIDRNFPF